jgi:hypothetical protein
MKMLSGLLLAGVTGLAMAQNAGKTPTPPQAAKSQTSQYWYDGGQRRPLYLSAEKAADFGPVGKSRATAADVLVPAHAVAGKFARDGISPVFSDQPSGSTARALPGGVIVTLKNELPEAEARAFLEARGLQPVRHLGSDKKVWLIAGDPGIGSLELANRLFESGEYTAAQPNWWQPRAKK